MLGSGEGARALRLATAILIHTGMIYIQYARTRYGDPLEIDDLAMALPEAKIVMGHGDPLGVHPALVGKHPNVYMDTSIHFATFARLIPGVGETIIMRRVTGISPIQDRIMLGSDASPTHLERLTESLETVLALRVPEDVKRKLLGDTAARLLKLPNRKFNLLV